MNQSVFQAPGRGLGPGSHGSGSVTATLSESDNDALLKTPFIANICFQNTVTGLFITFTFYMVLEELTKYSAVKARRVVLSTTVALFF